ncbi:zinc finger protein 142-like isoform X1 [Myxocyprinus asiaticus]|uniref:zinc finger protein 142-like isoform X1 n=1 Tax=Myxocyprinus asiaticus TaxID=70543 RepID=UPI0022234FA6|nr:zinc finger protein 142-like isoform X1 [Myxocyprinus asiaticus]XP_051564759.1 zinc finger protein 142-like isoform X1 [Myxocyprinus asiaticus]XP_051564761.1 zinc finger protein 142-like isoform X1 [Myxocyprinus asiaticus]
MEQQEPGCDAVQLSNHVENDNHATDVTSEALSQLKGSDVHVLPKSKKKAAKRLKASAKMGKKATTISQGKSMAKVDHVAAGTEHMFHTHICSECRRCFKTRSHLVEHMRLHYPDPSLQCPTCKHYFTSKSKLRVHKLRETGQKLHQCHLCEYGAVERNSLRRHLASVHGHQEDDAHNTELFTCPTCQKMFSQSQALKIHMKSHNRTQDGQSLLCFHKGCLFQYTEKKKLQKHALDEHQIEAIECRHHACSIFFGSREEMEKHFSTHQAYHCPHCDFSCSNKSRFQQHKRQGHPGKQELKCSFCPFSTLNPVDFDQHVGHFHANEKTHHCPQCSFATAHKRVLKRHMLMHTGEKPHKCTICDFRCRDETYLSKHMLTHSNDKQHMCSECGYVTKWKHYLTVHMRKHAGDLRYKCNQCSYRCHRIDQLNSHKLRHQEKSLICEVCAYSCKRKTELCRHMQLKHSTNTDLQPPVYQCKFCPYTTKYRQALHSHENCRHTRTRVFCCALCRYTTFSNTGLFLHKKKTHGYVPGDVGWLEKYAEKEKEQNSAEFTQSFFFKTAEPQIANSANGEHTEYAEQANKSIDDSQNISINDNENEAIAATTGGTRELTLVQQVSPDIVSAREEACKLSEGHPTPTDEEQCDTSLFNSQTSTGSIQTKHLPAETVNIGNAGFDAPVGGHIGYHSLHSVHQSSPEPGDEDDDNETAYCEDQIDPDNLPPVTGSERNREGLQNSEVHKESLISNSYLEPSASETRLQVMRRQDKDQAKALILEGRVQMLVVQTRNSMYQCNRCSYVTRKQAALIRHCRSSCQVMKAELRCQECGMQFKQQRSLNTHCLKKCRLLLRSRKKFNFASIVGQSGSNASIQVQSKSKEDTSTVLNQSKSGSLTLQPETIEVTDDTHSREQDSAKLEGPAIVSVADSLKTTSQGRHTIVMSRNNENFNAMPALAGAVDSVNNETSGYIEDDGRYTCKLCSFSSIRKVTIDRHCATCRRSTYKKIDLAENREQFEEEGSPSDYNQEEDGANYSERDSTDKERPQVLNPRFSCPNCPFQCHQKRALTSHEIKGCLKPGEEQCPHSSFVAKSEKSLNHHTLGHRKDKNATKGKMSAKLQCSLCSFTCKQERCLTQHVAVKHEGVRPHQCRFCAFSTIRRYRLEAHESLHTGVGRHSCEICGQTFGTTSRLRLHHQRIHNKQATHFCSLCDYRAYNLNDISCHNLSCHTGELNHHCCKCSARFSSDIALNQHCNRAHPDANSLSCAHCSFTCNRQAALKAHLRRDHSEIENGATKEDSETQDGPEKQSKISVTHQCLVCFFSTHKKLLLIQHMLDEHEDGPASEKTLKCDVCGFSCTHQVVFDQHVRSHGGTCLFKCTECEFSTRNKQKITWHIRIHSGEKPYRCEKCSYACADPSRLKYHMRIHMDERKYLCPECGYKCKWVNQLKYHMTKHTGAKPYSCEDCEYRTNRADALRIHRETRHRDVRSFICEKCGKAFKTSFLLKTHQRKHSEERPYVCSVCQKAFRWPAGLRHHYLSHTNQLPFHCLHCPYRAKQKFQVVKHLKRHHPDLPAQHGVGKDQETSSLVTQKAWTGEEDERQEDGQTASERVQKAADI